MDLIRKVNDTVTRLFEYDVVKGGNVAYMISDIFKISFDEIHTKWQIIYHFSTDNRIYIKLHKVEASSDDFIATAMFNIKKVKYVEHSYDETWTEITFTTMNFDIILERRPAVTTDVDPGIHFTNYEKLFCSEKLSDFKFICSDNQEIPAHKFALVAHSPVFDKMLMTPMKDAETQTANLDDINSETMLEVLRFLYTRKVENIKGLAPKLLYCADKYELNELKTYATRAMANNLNLDNVLKYYILANRYDEKDLLMACMYFIKRNYQSLCYHEDWIEIDVNIKRLFELISNDPPENGVFVLKTKFEYEHDNLPEPYKKFGYQKLHP